MSKQILVSSCLIGKNCAYDKRSRFSAGVKELFEQYGAVDICPEIAGGLPCPRERHECVGGRGDDVLEGRARVLSLTGEDHTEEFLRGAYKTLERSGENNIRIAVMKSLSPSCGKGKIHGGGFDKGSVDGNGVTAALLMRNGIRVFTENEIVTARREIEKQS